MAQGRTIVCGVDDSETAVAVTDAARWLAEGLGARLLIVHVVEEPSVDPAELRASVRERSGANEEDVRVLPQGPPADRLLETARGEDAELLVVGSRGRRSLHSTVLGSVSRTLATRADRPVVIVPPEVRFSAPGTTGAESTSASVVCGVDGSDHARAAAALGGRLAARLGHRLVLVHALQDVKAAFAYLGAHGGTPPVTAQPDAQRNQASGILDDALRSAGVEATLVIESGPPWDVLESVAEREHGRLLVVGARGLGGIRSTLFGSVAAHVAASATRPVVVLPGSARVEP
ncbi:MAG TPA: universal stress protein [Gaiellaceae bacterium]|nr:universal stress protein [Gaiellaceae bacterium]